MTLIRRPAFLAPAALLLAVAGSGLVYAQLEGADRGVPPIDSASTYEVTGISVDTSGKTAEEARLEGWAQAQLLGWKALWGRTNGRPAAEAPNLPDSALNGMVSGIIVQNEQIGPNRYVAELGVLFDRARTGPLLGGAQGRVRRSAPMLVIPVIVTGSTPYSLEFRNEWQKAWARFRTGNSPVDYVRPVGNGIDPLLLNAAQTKRTGRAWWRLLLDQYGAADVVVPEVHLERSYPGGPAIGTFTARFGPDNVLIERIRLRSASGSIPRLMDEGVRALDAAFTRALAVGMLRPDPSLIVEEPEIPAEILEEIEATQAPPVQVTQIPMGAANLFSVQVATPDAAAVTAAELAASRVPGVTSALTTSLALGGTSVMRVTYAGDGASLAAAFQSQGWSVSGSGNSLRISRGGQ